MKTTKIIYYISTTLFSIMLLMGAGMYFFNYEYAAGEFTKLGFPTWIIYPLAGIKIIGIISLWVKAIPGTLREWAYAGFFFNLILAFFAHLNINDGEQFGALIALILLITSRYTLGKLATMQ